MSEPVIKVDNLSKRYLLGHRRSQDDGLRHAIEDAVRSPFKWLGKKNGNEKNSKEEFWALKDVSFKVNQGDVVGIIGRNGAGKSTLLKILTRITEPTHGRIQIDGRVASLLEVGTGFHPELTGRENIYLNGAILGMAHAEIKRKFDEIVAFSEVEKFLDTPVKRYSSGMHVRLAFAVAAHLEPEILIVDEVLAVGDGEFQKKCMGKMKDIGSMGRTVIMVSHNMAAIENLSRTVIFMNKGQIMEYGPTKPTILKYQATMRADTALKELAERKDRSGSGAVRLTSFRVEDSAGQPVDSVRSGQEIDLVLGYECPFGPVKDEVDVGLSFGFGDNELISVIYGSYMGQTFRAIPQTGEFRFRIARFPFSQGRYVIGARVLTGGMEADWPRDGIAELTVESGDFYGTGRNGHESAPILLQAGLTLSVE
jgi:lipopolysaccharide transport system ATP-binding protein